MHDRPGKGLNALHSTSRANKSHEKGAIINNNCASATETLNHGHLVLHNLTQLKQRLWKPGDAHDDRRRMCAIIEDAPIVRGGAQQSFFEHELVEDGEGVQPDEVDGRRKPCLGLQGRHGQTSKLLSPASILKTLALIHYDELI